MRIVLGCDFTASRRAGRTLKSKAGALLVLQAIKCQATISEAYIWFVRCEQLGEHVSARSTY